MKNGKKRRRIDKLNVKQKKKKELKKEEKKNEFTQRTLQKRGNILHFSETWNTSHGFSTLLFTLLSIRYLRRPFFFIPLLFFLFNLSRLRKRSIDVTTSPRIVTFQSVLFVLNWPIALTTPSFHASLFSFFSLLSLNYLILLDSERTILSLAKLFFFFYLSTFAPIQRNVITLRPWKRNVRKAWSDRISVEESRNCLTNLEAASGRSGLIALPPIAHTLLKRFERLTR